ncbi:unnamed protein product [Rotaria sordida]|uniref:Uncharacterized protein n=1 Tax=Rotaria sordida TaxID=392033 RepID=A0A813UTT8_9BILA|nr:unnamed protein product [Rotaria sordida]
MLEFSNLFILILEVFGVIHAFKEGMATSAHASAGTASSSLQETLEVGWLDSHICEDGQHQQIKSYCQNISKFISKWNFFDSCDKFNDYIKNNPNVKLIMIMSGRFARQLLALVSPRENLHSVYVFTINIERTTEALGEEPKLKGVFNVENTLYDKLKNDLSELFWEEGKKLVASNHDQEARLYFDEAKRLVEHIQ